MSQADPAMEWLALARTQPEIKQLSLGAFAVYCRHMLLMHAMPNVEAFMQQKSAGRDEAAELVRRLRAEVKTVEGVLEYTREVVHASCLARLETGRVCLASIRRALDITPPAPCAEGVCCFTGLTTGLARVVVHTPRSQSGTQKETFVIANFLWSFVAAWALIGMAPAEVVRLSQLWLVSQNFGIERLDEVPTEKHLKLFTSLNQALKLVQRYAACPGFIV